MKAFAAEAARTVGRRLRARGQEAIGASARRRGHAAGPAPQALSTPVPLPQAGLPPEAGAGPAAEEAELDALRGALVRELDRLASADGSSAGFRRA
jgi:hypothetical protein